MRYSNLDPFDQETGDAPGAPDSSPQGDSQTAGDSAMAAEPVAADATTEPAAAEPAPDAEPASEPSEPPLWSTADDHILHLPPQTVERVVIPVPRPWRRRPWPRRRRRIVAPRRNTIGAVGQLVRAARRIGTWRSRFGGPVAVFRSRFGGRPFRIMARPRAGLRNEILSIEPELGEMESELESPTTSGSTVASATAPIPLGIDAASVDENRHADWQRAKKEGPIEFAIIRSNYGHFTDSVYKREWPRIKDAGLVRGPYILLRYGKGAAFDPVRQAKAMIKTVGPLQPGDLPPTLDVEFPGGRAKTGLTARQCLEATRAAWKVLKDHYGVAPIIYTSARVWREDLNNLAAPDLVESPLWVTRYLRKARMPAILDPKTFVGGKWDPLVPQPWGDKTNWWIHQYQGDARKFPGFFQVDMNRFNAMTVGATGDRVKWVQRRLGIAQSGTLDATTAQALRAFKQKNGLPATAIVCPRTFAFLCWSNPAAQTGSQRELGEMWSETGDEMESGWNGAELEEEQEARGSVAAKPVRARILWPALGFPAVITPSERPSSATLRDGDATKCVCLLVLSDNPRLSAADAARYLRYVAWNARGRRHIASGPGSFAATDIVIRPAASLTVSGRKDTFGEHVRFGANGKLQHGITGCLANRVRDFYRTVGLAHLYEIRISEAATARLQDGQYQLFWNNEKPGEGAPSDELALLLNRFVPSARSTAAMTPQDRAYLLEGYRYEYGSLYAPWKSVQTSTKVAAEILHPLFVRRHRGAALRIGHVTDTHIDVRADVYDANLNAPKSASDRALINKAGYNNFNKSFREVYDDAKRESDVLLLTGDLIDYGRGHWGLPRAGRLQDDASYRPDRNWFLFSYLLASGKNYEKPAYTILGNHDWRLNPYPPFSPGSPKPNELLHGYASLGLDQQKRVIELAHGDGYKRGYSYTVKAENIWQLLKEKTGDTLKTFGKLVAQTTSLDVPGYPTETSFKSIEWYLLSINPFLDYAFTLPGKQSVLMLDWAKTEKLLFDDIVKGEKWGYSPFDPSSAAGTPRPSSCLTPLQQKLTMDFVTGPSQAKVVGVHAPPISPYWDWFDSDLLLGRKTYKNPQKARGPSGGHPLFANHPEGAPYGMVAERGAVVKAREWFIKAVADPKHSVRMVLSGHIHRNGLYVVYPTQKDIYVPTPNMPMKQWRLKGALLLRGLGNQTHVVRGVQPPAVARVPEGTRGPLYITTTSAGPRGSFEERPLSAAEQKTGKTMEPGSALLELASDGTIKNVQFRFPRLARGQHAVASPVQREVAAEMW